ncbi:MAG TPA: hypothetical protein VF251_08370, partial [Pyrinomonadaceae bacterium]
FLVASMIVGLMICAPLLSNAHPPLTTTTLTIVNNSNREIRHVYLSPADQNNWGDDQLGNSVIAAGGGSVTLNVACDAASIKVIAEDHQGCFLYKIVTCSETTTWTITNDATPDCGGVGN